MRANSIIEKYIDSYSRAILENSEQLQKLLIDLSNNNPQSVKKYNEILRLSRKGDSITYDVIKGLVKEQTTDVLTGMPNRKVMVDVLDNYTLRRVNNNFSSIKDDEDVVIGLADLDFFKHINDSQGHKTGDKALQTFFTEFNNLEGLILLSRLGGDEGSFLMQTDGKSDFELAKSVYDSVHGISYEIGSDDYVASASVGMVRINSLDWIIDEIKYDILGNSKTRGYTFMDVLRGMVVDNNSNGDIDSNSRGQSGIKRTSDGRVLLSNLQGSASRETSTNQYERYLDFVENISALGSIPSNLRSKLVQDNYLSIFSLIEMGGISKFLREGVSNNDIFSYLENPSRLAETLSSVGIGVADIQMFGVKNIGKSGAKLGNATAQYDVSQDIVVQRDKFYGLKN